MINFATVDVDHAAQQMAHRTGDQAGLALGLAQVAGPVKARQVVRQRTDAGQQELRLLRSLNRLSNL